MFDLLSEDVLDVSDGELLSQMRSAECPEARRLHRMVLDGEITPKMAVWSAYLFEKEKTSKMSRRHQSRV